MKSEQNELISIIMGIYNCADTLPQAIDSILSQTYSNWELIMCDDCSKDDTYEVANNYLQKYPNKIKLIRNEKNSQLAFSLNHCLKYALGFYIARMDGDDYCAPDRLEKELNYLKTHPDVDMVGSLMQRFNNTGIHDIMPAEECPDKYALRNGSCFFHATILTYRRVFDAVGGYTVANRTLRGQDYDLWFKFFHHGFRGVTLQEPLYFVREDQKAIRRRTRRHRLYYMQTTINGYRLLGYPKIWLVKAIIVNFIKLLTPYFIFDIHRKIQAKRKDRTTA